MTPDWAESGMSGVAVPDGTTYCKACDAGRYKEDEGNEECAVCPTGMRSSVSDNALIGCVAANTPGQWHALIGC